MKFLKVYRSTVKGTLQYNNGDANENVTLVHFIEDWGSRPSSACSSKIYYLAIHLL